MALAALDDCRSLQCHRPTLLSPGCRLVAGGRTSTAFFPACHPTSVKSLVPWQQCSEAHSAAAATVAAAAAQGAGLYQGHETPLEVKMKNVVRSK